jgi:hypothetical protein
MIDETNRRLSDGDAQAHRALEKLLWRSDVSDLML